MKCEAEHLPVWCCEDGLSPEQRCVPGKWIWALPFCEQRSPCSTSHSSVAYLFPNSIPYKMALFLNEAFIFITNHVVVAFLFLHFVDTFEGASSKSGFCLSFSVTSRIEANVSQLM